MRPILPADFPSSTISKEAVAALPIQGWEGQTVLGATPAEIKRARTALRAERVVGFDTENRLTFRLGEHHLPSLAQAATANAAYLFSLRHLSCAPVLLLSCSQRPLSSRRELRSPTTCANSRLYSPSQRSQVIDCGALTRRHGLPQSGVRNLAANFPGFRIAKSAKTLNWAAARLSPAQLAYATTDVWACRERYLHFEALGLAPEPHRAETQ